jgi:(p)ppGpp synthase/HD superfamily hydrolase
LVIGASEVLEDRENTSWKERKRHTIIYLLNAPFEVKIVSCADKLSNIRSMIKDDTTHGGKLWERFNAGFEDQKWYYTELVKSLAELKDYEMYIEFKRNVNQLFESS